VEPAAPTAVLKRTGLLKIKAIDGFTGVVLSQRTGRHRQYLVRRV
jgi:hypothetical protein